MDKIRRSMVRAAGELRRLAKSTSDPALRGRLLEQADRFERASREDSRDETEPASKRPIG